MKRFITLLLIAAAATSTVLSAPLSPEQALRRVQHDSAPGARCAAERMTLTYTAAETAQPAYYVFSSDQGYVIAGADDLAAPVLGYAPGSTFAYDSLPAQLRWWLGEYASQLQHARECADGYDTSVTVATARPQRLPILPLVATRWNQGTPYNDLCPVYGTERTVTGCVATAMAQILRYWKYPAKGNGSNSYVYNGITNSFDFGATTFDWDNMTHCYSSSSTPVQCSAVATLMRACGVAVNMMYNVSSAGGSGAYSKDVVPALVKYMGYAPSTVFESRPNYGLYEWEDMVYSSLQHGCPVYYAGHGSAGGHAFVVDGYEGDGYFHLNWGWGGSSDGYFLLTALDPSSLGIGGGGGGFNSGQGAAIDLRPTFPGSKAPYLMGYSSPFTMSLAGSTLTLAGFGGNTGSVVIPSVTYAYRLLGENGKTYTYKGNTPSNLKPNYGYNSNSVTISPRPADGTYVIEPFFIVSDGTTASEIEARMAPYMRGKYRLEVTGGQMTLKELSDNEPVVTALAVNSSLYVGGNFSFSADCANNGPSEIYQELFLGWFDTDGNFLGVGDAMMTDIVPGEVLKMNKAAAVPKQVTYNSSKKNSITAGNYKIAMLRRTNSDLSAPTFNRLTKYVDVTINPAQTSVTLSQSDFRITDSNAVHASDIHFSINLKAVEGDYFQPVYFWVRQNNVSLMSGSTTPVFISQGTTKKVEWSFQFDQGKKGETYELMLNYRSGSSNKYLARTNFIIGTAGVTTVSDAGIGCSISMEGDVATLLAPGQLTSVEVYSLQGLRRNVNTAIDGASATIDIASLPSGIYLLRAVTDSGTHTLRLVK